MKVRKLKNWLKALRQAGGIKSLEMEKFAKALGRKKSKVGKEPTWINEKFPNLPPVSIPHHSVDLNRFTAGGILDQLENDLEKLEMEEKRKDKEDE